MGRYLNKISKNRFSELVEDLCRMQLKLAYVLRKREKGGVFVHGVRLRPSREERAKGFLLTHLQPPAPGPKKRAKPPATPPATVSDLPPLPRGKGKRYLEDED
jgi:hypothetical protein